jgi:hypothetical protein
MSVLIYQAVEKRPSTALHVPFVTAAQEKVRLSQIPLSGGLS